MTVVVDQPRHIPKFDSFAKLSQLVLIEQKKAGLSAQEILIWDYIMSFCNHKSRCAWVSQKTMALVLEFDIHNLARILRSLRRKGWLVVKLGSHKSRDLFPVCPTLDVWTGRPIKKKEKTVLEQQYSSFLEYDYEEGKGDAD